MSEPNQNDSEMHEHHRLVDRIARLAGPRDLAEMSDAELEAMLAAFSDAPSSPEETERLLARFWSEVSQPPAPVTPPAPVIALSVAPFENPSATPLPASSPVLGFLGNLANAGGSPPVLWTLLVLVIGMVLTLTLTVVLAINGIRVRIDGPGGAATASGETGKANPARKDNPTAMRGPSTASVSPVHPAPVSLGPATVARLTRLAAVQWATKGGELAEWSRVGEGQEIGLKSGLVELTFDCGAQMLVRGPAKLTVLGPLQVKVASGRFTTRVGKDAQGFTLVTPSGRVIDLGTEFGLMLDERGGMAVAVFEGKVDIEYAKPKQEAPASRRLVAGEAVHVGSKGQLKRLVAIDSDTFPRLDKPVAKPQSRRVIEAVSDNVRLPDSAQFYEIVPAGLQEGARAYVDRLHQWKGVTTEGLPEDLAGADYIEMFNNDKCRTDFELAVKLAGPADLYIFTDDRVQAPDWVARRFTRTGWKIGMQETPKLEKARRPPLAAAAVDAGKDIDNTFSVWRLFVPREQTVELGPSRMHDPKRTRPLGPWSQTSMYGIAAVARPDSGGQSPPDDP
jgi:hypothetical protein